MSHINLHHSPKKARTTMSNLDMPSPTMNAKTHKHYKSHPHADTPHPVVEHARTWDSTDSSKSNAGSFFDVHKPKFHVPKITSAVPNPVSVTHHSVEDHMAEWRYQRYARSAKKEAQRLSEHKNEPHRFSLDANRGSINAIPEYEAVTEDWTERDQQAWAAELQKRELAKRRTEGGSIALSDDQIEKILANDAIAVQ